MLLAERGRLDLDSPVQRYCAAFPEKPWPITVRELLAHLGGIRAYRSDSQDDPEVGNTKHFDNPIEAGLQFFRADPLIAQPGTKFSYSTHGYIVIGCSIEGASGQSYTDFVRENVFGPAGMASTVPDDRYTIIPHRTRFYSKNSLGETVNADFEDAIWKLPAGAWLSSAEDLARFEVALLNDRLLRRETRDLMWTRQKTSSAVPIDYALGWEETGIKAGVETIGHEGGQQGTKALILLAPGQRAGIVVLTNSDAIGSGIYLVGEKLMTIVLANSHPR